MTTRIYHGHAPDVLASLEPGSVHLCVTSPPYLWLRSYGTEPQVWPAPDSEPCAGEHEWGEEGRSGQRLRNGQGSAVVEGGVKGKPLVLHSSAGAFCLRCGAWRGELRQEPTPELFVSHLVDVFRAVRRVLRDDGTLWVNLSGTFFNDAGGQNGTTGAVSEKAIAAAQQNGRQKRQRHAYLKPLDWVDTPGLFRDAMLRDGWHRGLEITLVKRSPLPESVKGWRWERCRVRIGGGLKDHGRYGGAANDFRSASGAQGAHVGGTGAVIDGRAEWEDCPGCPKCEAHGGLTLRKGSGRPTRATEKLLVFGKTHNPYWDTEASRVPLTGATVEREQHGYRHAFATQFNGSPVDERYPNGKAVGAVSNPAGRNMWDWSYWPVEQSRLQHYAAYPRGIPRLAVTVGTSERGVCPHCQAPWARVVERGDLVPDAPEYKPRGLAGRPGQGLVKRALWPAGTTQGHPNHHYETATTGWRPTCRCPAHEPIAAVVLDCFGGSGTTGVVADQLGRDAVLIDLNGDYVAMAAKRITQDAPLFVELETAVHNGNGVHQRGLFDEAGVGAAAPAGEGRDPSTEGR